MVKPERTPPKKPLYVLPEPSILFPSMNFFPRSIGFFPSNRTAEEFGTYAGIINHRAIIVVSII